MQADLTLIELSKDQLLALVPYLWLCGGLALATIGAGLRSSPLVMRLLHAIATLPFAALLLRGLGAPATAVFGTSLEIDNVTRIVGATVAILSLLSGLYCAGSRKDDHGEWSPLMIVGVLGLSLLPGARDWVAFFVALETLAISGYVLAAVDHQREGSLEASLKYLLMGAFASSLLLMGMTLLFGATGSFDFAVLREKTDILSVNPAALVGSFFVLASLAFKVALFPFHMWAPDVYQAAPAGAAAFLASATKISVFAAAAVSFDRSGLWAVPGVQAFLQVLAIASVIGGNLLAAAQKRMRRMLAYSSVANAGYAALALSVGAMATSSMILSLMIYGLTVVAAFGVVESFRRTRGIESETDIEISSIGQTAAMSPLWLSLVLTVCLFSLAGIPPLPGFLGKYLVLSDVWASGFHLGAGVLVLGTLLGLAYYLRVLVPLYFQSEGEKPARIPGTGFSWSSLSSTLALLLLMAAVFGFNRLHQWVELAETSAR